MADVAADVVLAAYEAFLRADKRASGEVWELLDDDLTGLEVLMSRYRKAAPLGHTCDERELLLVTWFVASVGPRQRKLTPAKLEAAVAATVVAPKWVLSTPTTKALMRRLPCRPLVSAGNEELLSAYDGLLEHVEYMFAANAWSGELMHSAVPWRVIALADRMEPDDDDRQRGMPYRLGILRRRTLGAGDVSRVEELYWDSLDEDLVRRRNALTHMSPDGLITFMKCVDTHWGEVECLEATAGIALAVLGTIADELRQGPPPRAVLDVVLSTTEWMEDI